MSLYSAITGGEVALSAATAKTVLAITSPAQHGFKLTKAMYAFDGVTAANEPVLVEVVEFTQGTGTSTAVTLADVAGLAVAAASNFEGRKNFTSEPTGLSVLDEVSVTPFAGAVVLPFPLGEEYEIGVSLGIGLRFTAPQTVNVRATLLGRRI